MNKSHEATYREFYNVVNMGAGELEDWLATDLSKRMGGCGDDNADRDFCHGIVGLKRCAKPELLEGDYERMDRVIRNIHRKLSVEPDGDIENSGWRYDLMNWGHDPVRGIVF